MIHTTDTAYGNQTKQETHTQAAQDVDVKIFFDRPTAADSALATAKAKPVDTSTRRISKATAGSSIAEIIQSAISNAGMAGQLSQVDIHIGSVNDSVSSSSTSDTGSAHAKDLTSTKADSIAIKSDTTSTGGFYTVLAKFPWYGWLILIIIVLFIILGVLRSAKIIK